MTTEHSLKNKLALVTGVTSGIGAATVQALLAEDMRVIGVGRDAARLDTAARAFGRLFRPLLVDLAEPAARQRALGELEEPVALLVNNAAECSYASPLSVAAERLARLFEINVTAALELTQAVASRMLPGAQIVNVSSVVARHLPAAKFGPYAASKAALDCLSEALRLELHPRGIRVSTIAPGLVDTPIYDKLQGFERTSQKLREQVPTWLTARDVASAIVWVATRPPHLVIAELSILPSAQAR